MTHQERRATVADIRETAKAEAVARERARVEESGSWHQIDYRFGFDAGFDAAWRLRGEADAEAVRRVHKSRSVQVGSQTHGGGPQYGDACTHCRVLWPCPTIRALDEGGQ